MVAAQRSRKHTDQTLAKAEAEAAVEASEAAAETVRADHVDVRQGGAARIEAQTVSINQGGASRIDARDVSVTQGGAGLIRTDNIRLGQASSAFAVITGRAEVAPGSQVFVLVARETSGDVRPVLDWRGALALVGGFLVIRRLLGLLRDR